MSKEKYFFMWGEELVELDTIGQKLYLSKAYIGSELIRQANERKSFVAIKHKHAIRISIFAGSDFFKIKKKNTFKGCASYSMNCVKRGFSPLKKGHRIYKYLTFFTCSYNS